MCNNIFNYEKHNVIFDPDVPYICIILQNISHMVMKYTHTSKLWLLCNKCTVNQSTTNCASCYVLKGNHCSRLMPNLLRGINSSHRDDVITGIFFILL